MRAEVLLSTPVRRFGFAGSHLLLAAVGSAVLLAATGLGAGLAYGIAMHDVSGQVATLLGAGLAQWPAAMVSAAIAVALFGLAPRASNAPGRTRRIRLARPDRPLLQVGQPVMDLSPFTTRRNCPVRRSMRCHSCPVGRSARALHHWPGRVPPSRRRLTFAEPDDTRRGPAWTVARSQSRKADARSVVYSTPTIRRHHYRGCRPVNGGVGGGAGGRRASVGATTASRGPDALAARRFAQGDDDGWSRSRHRGSERSSVCCRLRDGTSAAADGIARHASLRSYVFVAGAAVTVLAAATLLDDVRRSRGSMARICARPVLRHASAMTAWLLMIPLAAALAVAPTGVKARTVPLADATPSRLYVMAYPDYPLEIRADVGYGLRDPRALGHRRFTDRTPGPDDRIFGSAPDGRWDLRRT